MSADETMPPWADPFQEDRQPDGTVKVTVYTHPLRCPVCGNETFRERTTLLNTKGMAFFNLEWANKSAENFICARCGYIYWFLPR